MSRTKIAARLAFPVLARIVDAVLEETIQRQGSKCANRMGQKHPSDPKISMGLWIPLFALLVSVAGVSEAEDNVWTNIGLKGEKINALVIDPSTSQTLYAGTDRNGVFKSEDGGTSWREANTGLSDVTDVDGDIEALVIDPSNPQTLYAGASGGSEGGVCRSENGGTSWRAVNTGLTDTNVIALAIDPSNPQTLYAGTTADGVFKSEDGGASWRAVNTGLTDTVTARTLYRIVQIIAIDPVNPQTLYAGTASGMFKSEDGGGTWREANTGLTKAFIRGAIAIDPVNPQILYAGPSSGGVFKSEDGGASWRAVNTGLTDGRAWALAIDPATPQTLYAGTMGGVFKSEEGGASWKDISAGLTNTAVYALAIDPANPQTLYAGTDGGGTFAVTFGDPPTALSADFNGDGAVNFQDFLQFVVNYGRKQGAEDFDARFDLSGDGEVNFPDFLEFVQAFGTAQ